MSNVEKQWVEVCEQDALVKDAGVCALVKDQQVAIFHLERSEEKLFAVSNYCPIGKANVISRGIVGSVANEPVIASPLYKQQFSLKSGRCLQQEDALLKTYPVRLENGQVQILA
ncbi:nitrite reductase small subunit NirD [Thalassotalea crassostreae]|uniref:nitrite reductase small subunit NirD n=1 Tax=Thalassotalea crassostreae TaxID=1763536 RepID=UPI0008388F98|nr:nitrite reductase small subunit NirD [Thalassotalea crassostreae]